MLQANIDELGANMKTAKQEVFDDLMPIINGLIIENTKLQERVDMLTKNVMMFREKLKVSEDEPYDNIYDYQKIKSNRKELHAEFKNIYRFFKKSINQTYAPVVAFAIPTKRISY